MIRPVNTAVKEEEEPLSGAGDEFHYAYYTTLCLYRLRRVKLLFLLVYLGDAKH